MLAIELIIIVSCVILTLIFARISNSATPPKWLANDGVVGLIIGALSGGILFSIVGFIVTAEEITGSKTLDVFLGIAALIGVGVILTMGTRNGKLARK